MKKKLLFFLGVLVVAFVSVLVVAWRNLHERINSSEFKEQLELHLSHLLQGKMEVGSLQGSLGFCPSVAFKEIRYAFHSGDLGVEANELFVSVRNIIRLKSALCFGLLKGKRDGPPVAVTK